MQGVAWFGVARLGLFELVALRESQFMAWHDGAGLCWAGFGAVWFGLVFFSGAHNEIQR
jgi:hypothetical protein